MQMRRVPFEGFAGTSGGPAAHAFIHPTKAKDAQSFPVLLRGDILASSNGKGRAVVAGLREGTEGTAGTAGTDGGRSRWRLRKIDSAWLQSGSV